MILDATRRIVENNGAPELSARVIAREIGYAPGTLYNLFRNLDDLLLHVEAELLDELDESLANAIDGRKTPDAIRQFASAYVGFAFENARLWHLIQNHQPLMNGKPPPDQYLEKVFAPAARLEPLLARMTDNHDVETVTRTARLLWSAVHGVVQVATTEKFGALPRATTTAMVEELVENYLIGISITRDGDNSGEAPPKPPRARHAD
jgi:AcrR family transcriptional regulator